MVVVDVVQMQQRQDAGISAAASGEALQVGAAKLAAQQAGGEAERPLVEIAGDDARAAQAGAAHDLIAHQARTLSAALAQSGAQVHVEQMQDAAFSRRREFQVGAQASAPLAADKRQQIALPGQQRQASDERVAVGGAGLQFARLAKTK